MKKFNRIHFYGFLGLSFFPVLPFFLISLVYGFFVLSLSLKSFSQKESYNLIPKRERRTLVFAFYGFFFVLALRMLLTGQIVSEINNFSAALPLLLTPLPFFFSNFYLSNKEIGKIMFSYVTASLLLGVSIIGTIGYFIIIDKNFSSGLVRQALDNSIIRELHPIYVSLIFIFAIFILLKKSIIKKSKLAFASGVFLISMVFLIESRIGIISMIIILLYFICCANISLVKRLLLFSSLAFFAGTTIVMFPSIKNKFERLYFSELTLPNKKWPTSPQIRIGIYTCAFNTFLESPWLGYGVVTSNIRLNECYNRYQNFQKIEYNTHNYFLFVLISSGFVGLIFFILFLFFMFKCLRKGKPSEGTLLLIIFCLFLLVENILSRSVGVMVYVFFVSAFILHNFKAENH